VTKKKEKPAPRRGVRSAGTAVAPRPAGERRSWTRDRAGKEADLIRAFDTVLARAGWEGIGVNAVIEEAGVGKNLLYRYFGGLGGLAKAWSRSGDFLPTEAQITGGDTPQYAALSTAGQIANNYRRYADELRRRPRTLEMLAQELVRPNELTDALSGVRSSLGQDMQKYFTRPSEYRRRETVALMIVLYAAVTYLTLRARTAPRYFWYRLDRPRDWAEIGDMLELVARRVLGEPAAPARRTAARTSRKVAVRRK
jgi:AcrR family transcriptional regulator